MGPPIFGQDPLTTTCQNCQANVSISIVIFRLYLYINSIHPRVYCLYIGAKLIFYLNASCWLVFIQRVSVESLDATIPLMVTDGKWLNDH